MPNFIRTDDDTQETWVNLDHVAKAKKRLKKQRYVVHLSAANGETLGNISPELAEKLFSSEKTE